VPAGDGAVTCQIPATICCTVPDSGIELTNSHPSKKFGRIIAVMMTRMPKSKLSEEPVSGRALDIEEVRLVSDLRIMHSKVDELFQVISSLKSRNDEAAIHKYADQDVLTRDIERVDAIYMWFLRLKEESRKQYLGDRR
jgi:hypothetical protein